MGNLEATPVELACGRATQLSETDRNTVVEALESREVPLGGPRAIPVRRTLPQRHRSLIGAWCFADRYGPDDVSITGGMDVAPHPHTGLQTVSWLFTGEIEHRDSGGVHKLVRPPIMRTRRHGTASRRHGLRGYRSVHADDGESRRQPSAGGAARRYPVRRGDRDVVELSRPQPRRDRRVPEAWQTESDQFGRVEGYRGRVQRPPAPPLPNVRIRPRR